jgi:hypothetical protein
MAAAQKAGKKQKKDSRDGNINSANIVQGKRQRVAKTQDLGISER